MKPEFENNEKINFNIKTQSDVDEETKKVKINSDGFVERQSHSNYYGLATQDPKTFSIKITLPDEFIPSTKIKLKKSKIYGYGVFSNQPISSNDVIEEMLCTILDTTENIIDDWVLNRFALPWPCDCDMCKINGKSLYLTSGYGMFYNHSDLPNAFLVVEKEIRRAKIVALREIELNEEITIYYGKNYKEILERQKKLDKRPDVPEGIPAKIGKLTKFVPDVVVPDIIKSNDNSIEFRGRKI